MANRTISDLWRTLKQFFRVEGGLEGKIIEKPSNPSSGYSRLYPKSDGWYYLDADGDEHMISEWIHLHYIEDLYDFPGTMPPDVHASSHGSLGADPVSISKSQVSDFPAFGTTSGTICEGNDSRLSDSRTPTSHTHAKADLTDATATPTAGKIPIADGSGKLDGWVTGGGTPSAHASSHIRGASDEIDGDKLDIDWNPSNYTPTTVTEADNSDHLSAHLKGIDTALGSVSGSPLETVTITAGEALSQYDMVYRKSSDTKFYKAANNSTKEIADVSYIVTQSSGISANGTGSAVRLGKVTNGSWNWTANLPIYLSTAGGITQTEPTTNLTYWIPLGIAESATEIFFNIGTGYLIDTTNASNLVGKIQVTAGEALSQYQLVYGKVSDSKVYIASNDDSTKSDVIGMVYDASISNNAAGYIRTLGVMTNAAWSWTPLTQLILGTNGAIIALDEDYPPANVKPVGIALTATSIMLDIQTGFNVDTSQNMQMPDVMGGRMDLVSATSIKWGFMNSNEAKLHNGTNWIYCQLTNEPTLTNTATDLAGTALAVDKIYDVFLKYSNATTASLEVIPWNTSTAGSSVRYGTYAAGTTYAKGARVVDSSVYYVSLQNSNTGNTPASSPNYWVSCGTDPGTDYRGLYRCDGRLVLSPKATGTTVFDGRMYRWLGVIYTYNNSSVVNFKDEETLAGISNFYNRKPFRIAKTYDPTNYTLASSTSFRAAGGAVSNTSTTILLAQTDLLIASMEGNSANSGGAWGCDMRLLSDATQMVLVSNSISTFTELVGMGFTFISAGLHTLSIEERVGFSDTSKTGEFAYFRYRVKVDR